MHFHTVRRCWHSADGATLVEFALIAPVMAILLIGLIDVSTYISASLSVQRAARAGGEYAVLNNYNATGISGAITSASASRSSYMTAISATPVPRQWCGCPDPVTGISAATCGTQCAPGVLAGTYVDASAQATYTPLFAWPGFGSTRVISSTSTVRIE